MPVLTIISPTAVDAVARTPTDAPPTGHLAAASEITPDESLEQVTGLIEHLSVTGAGALVLWWWWWCFGAATKATQAESAASKTSAIAASCAYCGKEGAPGVASKRCGRCKLTTYCGAECQKAGWRVHKVVCGIDDSSLPGAVGDSRRQQLATVGAALESVVRSATTPGAKMSAAHDFRVGIAKVGVAATAGDWRGVILWEGRLEGLMEGQSDDICDGLLSTFILAHAKLQNADSSSIRGHRLAGVKLLGRRIGLLKKMQRFRDQGEAMCALAKILISLQRLEEGRQHLERARAVAEAHGFFSVECRACQAILNPEP